MEQTREAIHDWLSEKRLQDGDYLFPSRVHHCSHLSTRQYARIVDHWVASIGLDPQFPHEIFDGTLSMGYPSTYIHRSLSGVVHMQTVVPLTADGDLDLSFKGLNVGMVTDGPPQSAQPTVISMSLEQYEHLGQLRFMKGDHQEMCKRIYQRVEIKDDQVHALVLSTDMALIKDAMEQGDTGAWQDLFRGIMEGTNGG